MKKIFYLLVAIVMAGTLFFTACTEEGDDQPPTIYFLTGTGFISSDATVEINSTFTVKVFAEENLISKSNISSIKVTRVFNLNSWDTTYNYNDPSVTLEREFTAQATTGQESIKFEVTDNNGEKASISITITTEAATGGPINTFTMKILGSYQSTTGSSFASIDGTVYTLAEAKTHSNKVDFLYWWGATTAATLGAPDDANAAIVYNNPTNGIPTWDIKNATRFNVTSLTAAQFDSFSDDTGIVEAAMGAELSRVEALAEGSVVAFMTVSGKYGVIKVTEIVAQADGQITIDVKVQQ